MASALTAMQPLDDSERDCIRFHLGFAVVAAVALALPEPALGLRILGLVVVYNLMLPAVARWRGHVNWLRLWLFLLPLSILQTLPDNFLAGTLGVLVFADTGSPRISHVPVFMAGLWVIPLFLLLMIGHGVRVRRGRMAAGIVVALCSLLLFGGSEVLAARLPIWQAQNVQGIWGAALYVLVPEMLLGVAALVAYESSRDRGGAYRLSAAAAVMLFYLGALALSYQLTERVLLA